MDVFTFHAGIKLSFLRLGTVDGPWQYDADTKTMLHRVQKKCLAVHPQTHQMSLMPCDNNNLYQQWKWKTIRPVY